jgi:MoaA/NifB/PqqE/SkfB family radical SAM enzyme
MKKVQTPTYNYTFDEISGEFRRWGKTFNDDPTYSPIGLEILDMEVSTVCHQGCAFCYKSNKAVGENMTFETFKLIVDKIPTLTQIAFGIGDIDGNPDLFKMFEYCREIGVVPNVTINGSRLTDAMARHLVNYCGAVAVSLYDENVCYDAVNKLTRFGLKQVNIHCLLSEETYTKALNFVSAYGHDLRLINLNAIVFLSLKQKGRGETHTRLSDANFKFLVNHCFSENIPFGFDSCTACKFLKDIKGRRDYKDIAKYVEPCESGLFSGYVNAKGIFHPCSFAENNWLVDEEIDLKTVDDFLQDVWYNHSIVNWRKLLLKNGRSCPMYEI